MKTIDHDDGVRRFKRSTSLARSGSPSSKPNSLSFAPDPESPFQSHNTTGVAVRNVSEKARRERALVCRNNDSQYNKCNLQCMGHTTSIYKGGERWWWRTMFSILIITIPNLRDSADKKCTKALGSPRRHRNRVGGSQSVPQRADERDRAGWSLGQEILINQWINQSIKVGTINTTRSTWSPSKWMHNTTRRSLSATTVFHDGATICMFVDLE